MSQDCRDEASMDNRKHLSLEDELSFLQKIIDQQNNIIVVSNGEDLIMVNHPFLDFFVQPSLNAFKREFGDLSNTFVRHDRYFHAGKVPPGENWIDALASKKDTDAIVSMVHLGEYEPKAFAVKVSKLEDNGEVLYVLTFTDITQFAIQANQYFYQATHDKLTGIYNRAHFGEVLDEMSANESNLPLAGMMISIDKFKKFNEEHGQEKGDEVLKDLVDQVNMHLRERDVFGRLGGKEFGLLLPATESERAMKIAENIREAISKMETYTDTQITVSISVSYIFEQSQQKDLLMKLEALLAKAKETGRDQVVTD